MASAPFRHPGTSAASEEDMKPGNRKRTSPGPPDRTGRTRRTAIVLRTPPPVLNGTAPNCGPPFGTKRPQVQSCHPDHSGKSLTCGNAVFCARYPTSQPSRQRPRRNKKEHEGTTGKAGADFDRQKNTRPPRTKSQTAGHSRVLQDAVILRPQRRGLSIGTSPGPGITADPKSTSSSGSGTSPSAPSAEDPVDRSALNSTTLRGFGTIHATVGSVDSDTWFA